MSALFAIARALLLELVKAIGFELIGKIVKKIGGLFVAYTKSNLIPDDRLDRDEYEYNYLLRQYRATDEDAEPREYLPAKELPFTPVKRQGKLGSCVGHAMVAAMECLVKHHKGVEHDLSELFAYSRAKEHDPWRGVWYSGTSTSTGARLLVSNGVCHENLCKYRFVEYVKATEEQKNDALKRRARSFRAVIKKTDALIAELNSNNPIVMGFKMFSEFRSKREFVDQVGRSQKGGHAVIIDGYVRDGDDVYFRVKNSWGTKWKAEGHGYFNSEVIFKRAKTLYAIEGLAVDYPLDIPEAKPTKPVKKKATTWTRFKRWLRSVF